MAKTITAASILAQLGIVTSPGCFDLKAARTGTSNVLTWLWPDNMKNALITGALNFFHLTVQRSTVASNSPTPATVVYTVTSTFPVPDVNWSDIKQWSPTSWNLEGNPDTYTDTWNVTTPVCYRLILNCEHVANKLEMDWIPALVIPVQSFTATTDGSQPRLNWGAPDPSWWPNPGTSCP